MKLLIDAQLPQKLCEIIESLGVEATHVDGMPNGDEASDSDIIKYADQNDLIILTKDSDFYHSHIAKKSLDVTFDLPLETLRSFLIFSGTIS